MGVKTATKRLAIITYMIVLILYGWACAKWFDGTVFACTTEMLSGWILGSIGSKYLRWKGDDE